MFELTTRHKLYLGLSATFLTSLLVADMTAGKFFSVGGLDVSVGVIPFPITFLLTDVVNEYYGSRGARFLTAVGALMLVFAFAIIVVARVLPVSPHSPISQDAFDAVFGLSFRFFAASLFAYLVGQLADIQAFRLTKRLTRNRHLWLRATGSTAISQIVDTTVVNVTALVGILPAAEIVEVTAFNYGYKMIAAVLLTPLLYVAHGIVTRRLGVDPAPVED
jgi:uncharacterized integral membrane protein (TIGR00697 family)